MTQVPLQKRDLSGSMAAAAESVSAAPDEYDTSELVDYEPTAFLGTGSTVLNCACTGNPFNGIGAGTVLLIAGGSDTGKTFIVLCACAEAANNPDFDNYDIVYDDVEAALAIKVTKMFGEKMAKRIRPPAVTQNGTPIYSNTVEDLTGNLVNHCRTGKPFIYVVDSVDALTDTAELERTIEYGRKVQELQNERGEYDADNPEEGMTIIKTEGSYKVNKPKILSEMLRTVCLELRRTGSILILISQLRDNVNARTAMFQPETRSGGRALKYYASHEIWLKNIKKINASAKGADGTTKTGGGVKLAVGSEIKATVVKNKINGFKREALYSIYTSYGIDDITSCIEYLALYGFAPKSGLTYDLTDIIGKKGTMASLVAAIDDNPDMYHALRVAVGEAWQTVEESVAIKRPPRYT